MCQVLRACNSLHSPGEQHYHAHFTGEDTETPTKITDKDEKSQDLDQTYPILCCLRKHSPSGEMGHLWCRVGLVITNSTCSFALSSPSSALDSVPKLPFLCAFVHLILLLAFFPVISLPVLGSKMPPPGSLIKSSQLSLITPFYAWRALRALCCTALHLYLLLGS